MLERWLSGQEAFAALAEDVGSVPCTLTELPTTFYDSSSGGISRPLQASMGTAHEGAHTCAQTQKELSGAGGSDSLGLGVGTVG